jgi:hypothetical protein
VRGSGHTGHTLSTLADSPPGQADRRPVAPATEPPPYRSGTVIFGLAQSCPLAILTRFQEGRGSGGGEMAFRAICVALVLSTLPVAGCGTAVNLVRWRPEDGGRSPFGGVRQDVLCIKKAENGECAFWKQPQSESEQHPQVAPMLFCAACAADLPLSLIGDVVTWPYTAAYSFINQPIPTPPVTQAPPEVRPQTSPSQLLPMPRQP